MGNALRIAIVDYGMGNLHSVRKAFEACGGAAASTRDPEEVVAADALVVPGVGSFGDCVENLSRTGLKDAIAEFIRSGKPYLGLCLGLQILFPSSEESPGTPGLGIIPGKVRRFTGSLKIPHMGWNTIRFPAPGSTGSAGAGAMGQSEGTSSSRCHPGDLPTTARGALQAGSRDPALKKNDPLRAGHRPTGQCPLFRGIEDGSYVYFVHSYYPEPEDGALAAAVTDYGVTFASAVWKGNLMATQFHPEKSQRVGLAMVRNFVAFAAERAAGSAKTARGAR